jgi:GT2 family glycosyltransferase
MNLNDVGVVVIGRNEGQRLINCLISIRAITSNIVYVDSASKDGSVAAAQRIGATVVLLDMDQPFTAARARNEGYSVLKSILPDVRFVQFVDGDCLLVPGWLERAVAFVELREDIAIVCGRRRERHPSQSVYNRLCDLEWNTPVGEAAACGGDSLVRASAFEEVRGFLPRVMAGEEPELCVRLREHGWKIWRLDVEMTLHDASMSKFSQWWTRSTRSGYGFAEVSRLHKASPFRIWRRAVPSALFWGALLPASIAFGSVFHPLFICAVLIYPIQVCSIAIRRGATQPDTWPYAFLTVAGKFAQARGIAKFYWLWLRGQTAGLIEYKGGT